MNGSSLPSQQAQPQLHLRLYLAGDAPNSAAALVALRAALAHANKSAQLEIIDVLETPERALADGVLVTPMLIRVQPRPERRILGNLRDQKLLLGVLAIDELIRD